MPRRRSLPFVLLLTLIGTGPGPAVGAGADRGVNAPYRDGDFGQWQAVFERPGREVYDRRLQVVAALGLGPGQVVADVGAGTGLYTRLLARAVRPGGRAIAVDPVPGFVEPLLAAARAEGLDNLEGVVNDQHDTGLAPASVDLAFVCDTYHHFEDPAAMLASLRRALRPGGALVVIDFERVPGVSSPWVLGHVRAGKAEVVAEIEAAGFRLTEDRAGLLHENFFLRFAPAGP